MYFSLKTAFLKNLKGEFFGQQAKILEDLSILSDLLLCLIEIPKPKVLGHAALLLYFCTSFIQELGFFLLSS